jgi:O-antigen/teichoic acid export membrane protein
MSTHRTDNASIKRIMMAKRLSVQAPTPLLARKTAAAALEDPTSRSENKTGVWTSLRRILLGAHALALADQAVVSGTSFVTMVVIGRATSPDELGVYALAIELLIWFQTSHEMLVMLPFTVQRHHPLGTPTEHAGSSLTFSWMLSVLALAVLATTASAMSALSAPPNLVATVWALAAVAPFALLREFGRRFAFAHLQSGGALVLDMAAAATQLGLMAWLARSGSLSAVTALGAVGAGCGVTGIAWLYLARANFAIRKDLLPKTIWKSWRFGKWLLATQLTVTLQIQINYWLLAWIVGTSATGVYAACASVASLANPLLLGSGNILNAKAAFTLKEGAARLRSATAQASLLLGAGMALFFLVVAFAGDDIVQLLYPGQEYAGHSRAINTLALLPLAAAIGLPPYSALASIGRSREIFLTGALGVAFTAVLAWHLIPEWGLEGAALAHLSGTAARSAARWLMFLVFVRQQDPDGNAMTMSPVSTSALVTRPPEDVPNRDYQTSSS